MCVPWPSWRLSASSMAEGGPNMLRIVSAVMAENSVPLISPRYKFTIGTSGEALSARTPSPSRPPSQINTQAAQADLPIIRPLLTSGTETCGLQAGHLQDELPPQPQCEAHGNAGDECEVMPCALSCPHTIGAEPEPDTYERSKHEQTADGNPPSCHRHQRYLPQSLRDELRPRAARRMHLP